MEYFCSKCCNADCSPLYSNSLSNLTSVTYDYDSSYYSYHSFVFIFYCAQFNSIDCFIFIIYHSLSDSCQKFKYQIIHTICTLSEYHNLQSNWFFLPKYHNQLKLKPIIIFKYKITREWANKTILRMIDNIDRINMYNKTITKSKLMKQKEK